MVSNEEHQIFLNSLQNTGESWEDKNQLLKAHAMAEKTFEPYFAQRAIPMLITQRPKIKECDFYKFVHHFLAGSHWIDFEWVKFGLPLFKETLRTLKMLLRSRKLQHDAVGFLGELCEVASAHANRCALY
jgi:hypothetical protein